MRQTITLFLFLLMVTTSCSLWPDDGIPSKNHSVLFSNKTDAELHVAFTADSRIGGRVTFYTTLDSIFILPVDGYFEIIDDAYDPGRTERAYAVYHSLDDIKERIHRLDVFKIIDSDTIRASLDILNKSRWYMADNDPLSFGATYHTYLYSIQDIDF